jgi:hypothetical protein
VLFSRLSLEPIEHKDVNMATTQPDLQKAKPPARGSVFTWTATILACAYIVWTGVMLYLSTPRFIDMYTSMGVDLSLSTKLVIGFYRFVFPVLFGGAATLVIVKQFFVREKWVSLSITLAAVVMCGYHQPGNRLGAIPSSV